MKTFQQIVATAFHMRLSACLYHWLVTHALIYLISVRYCAYVRQLQLYHAVQQHPFSELHTILLHTQLRMCPQEVVNDKETAITSESIWDFSLYKSTLAEKQQALGDRA